MAAKKAPTPAQNESETTSLELDGQKIEVDLDDLTFGEVEFIEAYFNCPLEDAPLSSGRGIMILAYLSLKKTDPTVTLDSIREKKISLLKMEDEDDPKADTDPPTEG